MWSQSFAPHATSNETVRSFGSPTLVNVSRLYALGVEGSPNVFRGTEQRREEVAPSLLNRGNDARLDQSPLSGIALRYGRHHAWNLAVADSSFEHFTHAALVGSSRSVAHAVQEHDQRQSFSRTPAWRGVNGIAPVALHRCTRVQPILQTQWRCVRTPERRNGYRSKPDVPNTNRTMSHHFPLPVVTRTKFSSA